MRVVHLPVYEDNPYQRLLMNAQNELGIETINGGGGGNFLRSALFRWKADILHFHWLHPYMIRPSALGTLLRSARLLIELSILKLFGLRIVWTVHNLGNHERRHLFLEQWFTKRFARIASAIIVHSQHAAEEAVSAFAVTGPSRIHSVPFGHYSECYPNHVSRGEAREKIGLVPRSIVFLFLGRIEPYKGVQELVCEFKSMSPDLILLIAGPIRNMQLEQAIRKGIGIQQNIMFHPGFVPDDRIQFYMNACDAVVLPYRNILTSSAAMLAMSFGRPCIAPRLSGMMELLDEQGAFLYDPSQPHALSEAIRAAANKGDKLSQMGAYNFAKVSSQNWAKTAVATLKIYEDVG